MPRGKTPLITVEIPANDECNDEEIARELTETNYKKGGKDLEFDIISPPVRITGRDPNTGKVVLDETYEPSEWDCLDDFLEHIRRGLPKLDVPERVAELKDEVAAFSEQLRFAHRDIEERKEEYKRLVGKSRRLSKRVVDEERLLRSVELETRTRARGELAQLAEFRLHRWSNPVISRIVKEARKAVGRI